LIFSHLASLCNKYILRESTITFCKNVLQKKLQHFVKCEGVILLGKKEICTFSPEEYACVKEYNFDLKHCKSFKRMLYNGIKYCSEDYAIDKKHNDSFILTHNMFAVIKNIINVSQTKVLILLQEIVVQKEPLLSSQDFKYIQVKRFISYGKYFCIQPFEIDAQCVFMDILSDKYLCKMPFGCYGD